MKLDGQRWSDRRQEYGWLPFHWMASDRHIMRINRRSFRGVNQNPDVWWTSNPSRSLTIRTKVGVRSNTSELRYPNITLHMIQNNSTSSNKTLMDACVYLLLPAYVVASISFLRVYKLTLILIHIQLFIAL